MKHVRKLGLAAILVGGVGLATRPLVHRAVFPGADTPIPETAALDRLSRGAERLDFAGADGTRLVAAWIPAREPVANAIYFHATNQAAADSLLFARDLAARGVSVCVPEHRGYGGLAGTPSVDAILDDARAAVTACPAIGPRILVGRSLGSGVAATMAGEGGADALVLVSPFTSLSRVASPFGWALAPADRLDSTAALTRVRVPITVVHGTRDGLVPFRMGREIADATGAKLIALDGVGHNELFLGEARTKLLDAIVDAAAAKLTEQPFDSLRSLRVRAAKGSADAS